MYSTYLGASCDRERLVEDVIGGQALITDSPIVRDLWAYVAFPEAYAYDPALAEELLRRDVEPQFGQLETYGSEVAERVAAYRAALDAELNIVQREPRARANRLS